MCTFDFYRLTLTEDRARSRDGARGREFLENWRNSGVGLEMYMFLVSGAWWERGRQENRGQENGVGEFGFWICWREDRSFWEHGGGALFHPDGVGIAKPGVAPGERTPANVVRSLRDRNPLPPTARER